MVMNAINIPEVLFKPLSWIEYVAEDIIIHRSGIGLPDKVLSGNQFGFDLWIFFA
jgi:hypothetical protein